MSEKNDLSAIQQGATDTGSTAGEQVNDLDVVRQWVGYDDGISPVTHEMVRLFRGWFEHLYKRAPDAGDFYAQYQEFSSAIVFWRKDTSDRMKADHARFCQEE